MSFLDSILSTIKAPPKITTPAEKRTHPLCHPIPAVAEIARAKREKERFAAALVRFRTKIKSDLDDFAKSQHSELRFKPMDKVWRLVIYEEAEARNLPSHPFGVEEVDRHVIVYRKETEPNEAELERLRNPGLAREAEERRLREASDLPTVETSTVPVKRKVYSDMDDLFVLGQVKKDRRSIAQIASELHNMKREEEEEEVEEVVEVAGGVVFEEEEDLDAAELDYEDEESKAGDEDDESRVPDKVTLD